MEVDDLRAALSINSKMNLKEPLMYGLIKRLLTCCIYKNCCCHLFAKFRTACL